MHIPSLILAFLVLFSSFEISSPGPDGTVVVENAHASYQFGQAITYQATFRSETPIREVFLFISPQGEDTFSVKISPNSQGEIIYRQDVKKIYLRPFTKITYWFQLLLSNNTNFKSEPFSFEYKDDRFAWQVLETPEFQINWYDRDLTFGQLALSISLKGLSNAQSYVNIAPPESIKIYIYNNSSDFLNALSTNNQPWIAGHTSPDINAILITIPPGPEHKLELERQIPHEIMHILQYQVMGSSFRQLPFWLTEGLASIAELYPNPEYQRVIMDSAENRSLHSVALLCNAFPTDASGAFLAYAQSSSFVQYLYQNYGSSGIRKLMEEYQNGLGCEEGVMSALGSSLTQLEIKWQQRSLRINPMADVASNLLPFLLVGSLFILPILIIASGKSKSR